VTARARWLPILAALACRPAPAGPTSPPTVAADVPADDPLRTVELPEPSDPSVSPIAWIQVGSQDDPPGKEGLAWVTAQLVAQGDTQQRSYQDILAALYPMAAGYSVRVDREMTTLHGRAPAATQAAFQELFLQALVTPAFRPEDFERIRQDALAQVERSLRWAQDEELGKAVLMGEIFAGTSWRHPEFGTAAGLRALTIEDVQRFHTEHWTRDRVVFGIAGGFSPGTKSALEAARARLPERGVARPSIATRARPPGRHVTLVAKPGADASISLGFPIGVRRGDRDYYALWIANSWLGEHRNSSSHLYQVIRGARGLNYGDYSYIEAFPQGGWRQMPPPNVARSHQIFEIWIRTLPDRHAHFALRAAIRELTDLVEHGLTPAEFELTRDFLRKYVLHFADTARDRLGYAIDDRFYGLPESHLLRFSRMMDELTVDDVNAAIRRHLQVADLQIAVVTGEAESLREALVTDAPSPMAYASEKPAAVLEEDRVIATYPLGIPAQNVRIVPIEEVFAR
jgi:zinc protease